MGICRQVCWFKFFFHFTSTFWILIREESAKIHVSIAIIHPMMKQMMQSLFSAKKWRMPHLHVNDNKLTTSIYEISTTHVSDDFNEVMLNECMRIKSDFYFAFLSVPLFQTANQTFWGFAVCKVFENLILMPHALMLPNSLFLHLTFHFLLLLIQFECHSQKFKWEHYYHY